MSENVLWVLTFYQPGEGPGSVEGVWRTARDARMAANAFCDMHGRSWFRGTTTWVRDSDSAQLTLHRVSAGALGEETR